MKKVFVIAGLTVLAAIIWYFQGKTVFYIKRMRTLDTMGQIYVSLSNSLGKTPLEKYNAVLETQKAFPDISVKDGKITDAWGNPIEISIQKIEKGYKVCFISGGSDGKVGTCDDVVDKRLILNEIQ